MKYSNTVINITLFLLMNLNMFSQKVKGSAYVEIESKTLEQLYEEAIKEGGEFVLRAGGDKSDQIDYYLDMFKKRFPKLKVTHSVDVSINHAPRYDNARAAGGKQNIPDVIQFQTLHRFTYYTEQGFLDSYKPKNWDKVFPDYKDPHGHWTGLYGVTFSNYVNTDVIPKDKIPRDALDYLDPALKGKVILTYPHDDDAVLYQFWNLKENVWVGIFTKACGYETCLGSRYCDAICCDKQRMVRSKFYNILGI